MDIYQVGDAVRVSVVFTNLAGVATDPTTVTLKYEDPSGNETTLVYLTDAEVVKDSTGNYHVDIATDEHGTWTYRWIGTGAVAQTVNGEFFVQPSSFDTNLTGWNELRERVYAQVRDSARTFVTESDIDIWLREGMDDLSSRLNLVQKEATGTTSGSVTLPTDYVDVITLEVARSDTDYDFVEFVDHDVFNSHQAVGSDPIHTLARPFNKTFELYPEPSSAAYTLRYLASTSSDLTAFTGALRTKLVFYATARAEAKVKEFDSAEWWMGQYERNLPAPRTTNANKTPGPISIHPLGNWFSSAAYLD